MKLFLLDAEAHHIQIKCADCTLGFLRTKPLTKHYKTLGVKRCKVFIRAYPNSRFMDKGAAMLPGTYRKKAALKSGSDVIG